MVGPSAGRCIIDFMLFVDASPITWNLKNNCIFESTVGINLDRFGIIWDHFGIYLGFLLESFWDHLGIILEYVCNHFRVILKSVGDHFGIMLESFWNLFGIILKSF